MATKARIVIQRSYVAALEDVWDLWTTKSGIESWWGPEGFRVEVRKLDLRPDGELHYAMIAEAPEMVAFMQQAKMQVVQECRLRYTEIIPHRRLSYLHQADFIPGVAPYDVTHVVDLEALGDRVLLTLTFDRMHDHTWTQRASQGWEQELGKLGKVLSK
jgi:uncharacterized protein YndB with AHSA1/START domain